MEKAYRTYSEYTADFCKVHGIKVIKVDNVDNNLNPEFIYINRIGDKTRIITEADKMRNLLCITFDTEKWDKRYLELFIQSNIRAIDYTGRHGTCQQHITCRNLEMFLAGVYNQKGQSKRELLENKIVA